jgi:hypothetical protein
MAMKNLKPRRHHEEREKGTGTHSCLMERPAVGLNEKHGEDEMGYLNREMEDWYRVEGNRSMAGAA